jgi:uncharacterized protein YyaL (SSP411 family)
MAHAHIDLYETTFDPTHLERARDLLDVLHRDFRNGQAPGFAFAPTNRTDLLAASQPMTDGAIPSGNAIAMTAMFRLYRLTGDTVLQDRAETILNAVAPLVGRHPRSFAYSLIAMEFMMSSPRELVLVGAMEHPATGAFLRAIRSRFLPSAVVAADAGPDVVRGSQRIGLLQNRSTVDGEPALYVCEGFACRQPITDPAQFFDGREKQER